MQSLLEVLLEIYKQVEVINYVESMIGSTPEDAIWVLMYSEFTVSLGCLIKIIQHRQKLSVRNQEALEHFLEDQVLQHRLEVFVHDVSRLSTPVSLVNSLEQYASVIEIISSQLVSIQKDS